VVTTTKLPQCSPLTQSDAGPEGAGGNLAALRSMAAPSDSSDDIGGTLETTEPGTQNIASDHGVTVATNDADVTETEEVELVRMERLWIRVQELEVEYALLGKA
jgi:hypothetical protein